MANTTSKVTPAAIQIDLLSDLISGGRFCFKIVIRLDPDTLCASPQSSYNGRPHARAMCGGYVLTPMRSRILLIFVP